MKKSVYAQYASDFMRQKLNERMAYLCHKKVINYLQDVISGEDPDASPEIRFKTAQELLNRYLGKPKESVELNNSVTLSIDL